VGLTALVRRMHSLLRVSTRCFVTTEGRPSRGGLLLWGLKKKELFLLLVRLFGDRFGGLAGGADIVVEFFGVSEKFAQLVSFFTELFLVDIALVLAQNGTSGLEKFAFGFAGNRY